MLARVISGGQSGADQAAWHAARAAGLATGGAMPRGFLTENGPRPNFAREFAATEHETVDPAGRTAANVREADVTLVFGVEPCSRGTAQTIAACREASVPFRVVRVGPDLMSDSPREVADWLRRVPVTVATLNVAGDRESNCPGIGERVERFLAELFRRLDEEE